MKTVTNQMKWRTTSYNGLDAEDTETTSALKFRKSSYTGVNNNCVEVAGLPCGAAVRDSKNPAKGHLPFPAAEWDAFLTLARTARP